MIRATYTARDYEPGKVTARYVRLASCGAWQWCEVGPDRRYDVRQGECDLADVPPELVERARALQGQAFAYVAAPHWPALERATA